MLESQPPQAVRLPTAKLVRLRSSRSQSLEVIVIGRVSVRFRAAGH